MRGSVNHMAALFAVMAVAAGIEDREPEQPKGIRQHHPLLPDGLIPVGSTRDDGDPDIAAKLQAERRARKAAAFAKRKGTS